MTAIRQRITPFLWFDRDAEEAASFYVSIFDDSRITTVTRYGKEGAAMSGMPEGAVMTIAFELAGQSFSAINGGPVFRFNEAISLVVACESQDEVDRYWSRLGEGGDPAAQQCGWLKDRFGVSWQIVPTELPALLGHPDPEKAQRAMAAMRPMKKLDLDVLRKAVA
jgi:predicted 3-demethylubiquinone-9 3-methyltransferase (glyoxalase superfamily)